MSYPQSILSTIILPTFLILAVPYFLVGGRLDFLGSMTESWVRLLGLLPFALGALLVLAGAAGSPGIGPGSTTPTGPYRFTRNPIPLGVLFAVAAQYLLYDWPAVIAYSGVLYVASDCLIRLKIEPAMLERHGAAYQTYLETVPRWLPRIRGAAKPSVVNSRS
jgi:protein-S-isoprenylcysteine O-methyltransferase Ste14